MNGARDDSPTVGTPPTNAWTDKGVLMKFSKSLGAVLVTAALFVAGCTSTSSSSESAAPAAAAACDAPILIGAAMAQTGFMSPCLLYTSDAADE